MSLSSLIAFGGVGLTYVGLIFLVWSLSTMGKKWGLPAQHDASRQNKLITTGPFALSRNPIYVSIVIFFVGFELALQSSFIFLVLFFIWHTHHIIKKEEVLLKTHFGQEYEHYMTRVPRYL